MDLIAQSYESLWGQVEAARRDDLPKNQLEVLNTIVDKATKEKEYGHLIKAQLRKVEAITAITPDSLNPEVDRLVKWEQTVRGKDEVLAAVLQSLLGRIYQSNPTLDIDNGAQIGNGYFKQSLSNKRLLADTKTGKFVPALTEGVDSKYFNNDLLHVLGMQAEDLEALLEFYEKEGNREAACLVAASILRRMPKKLVDRKEDSSTRLHKVDSLLQVYGDLEVAGELAILKYQFLEEVNDVKAERLIRFIDEAKAKWGRWPRLVALDNAMDGLTQPCFHVDAGCQMILPGTSRMIKVDDARNIPSLTVRLARTDIDVSKEYYLFNESDLAEVRKAIVKGSEMEFTHHYNGHQPYEHFNDSLELPPLKKGTYLLEFEAGDSDVNVERTLMYVSDVLLICEPQPDDAVRLIAVSATTGKPLPKAKIRVSYRASNTTLVCNAKGEVMYQKDENDYGQPESYVYTNDDHYCPSQQLWYGRYSFSRPLEVKTNTAVYTDRSIYRPGQQVHVGLIRYECLRGLETKALEGEKLEVVLRDANYKEVATKNVVTDKFGKADVDFQLPESGLTGRFTITANGGSTSFRVEEYKRPTFEVEIPNVEEVYKNGDTIQVKGYAKTYAGVPVQGAKVEYMVKRETSWWWRNGRGGDEVLVADSTITDEEGAFYMRVPMLMPDTDDEDRYGWSWVRFYDIAIQAMVTDQAFETHEAKLTLPLSNKSTAFSMSVTERMRKDEMKPVRFSLRNASGKEIDGIVAYTIDGGGNFTAEANNDVALPALNSGRHTIEAVCMGDTVKKDFVVFSLDDKKPCVETHDWFYASDSQFPSDGTPVYVQVGSSDRDTRVYYSVFTEEKVLEQGAFTLDNAIQTRRWVYDEKYASGLFLNFAWVRDGEVYSHRLSIKRPMPDKRIMLTWHTFRDKLKPGDEETWVLKALYPDGKPADAQLMATLYDKSLDQISSHGWYFNDLVGVYTPNTYWRALQFYDMSLFGSKVIREKYVPSLQFTAFDNSLFDLWEPRFDRYDEMPMAMPVEGKMVKMEAKAASADMVDLNSRLAEVVVVNSSAEMDEVSSMELSGLPDDGKEKQTDATQVRENLDETAFFMPKVAADEEGNMVLKFQIPESVTTWQFIGLATDTHLNNGAIKAEAVAKKDIMVQPNVPRFVRLGDKAQITTRIFNTTDKTIGGKAVMELVDPETEAVVFSQTRDFNLEANQTTGATFDYDVEGDARLLVCRIIAKGEGFSDGEQHYLPVLPSKELITRTMPFTQNGPQTTSVDLRKLFPKGVDDAKLTVEYTNNPAWMMIQALPTLAAGDSENAITQATAYYANVLGQVIMNMSPDIKQTVMEWRDEFGDNGSMASNLAKNEELKDLLLNETPWVGQADKEESQKRSLVKFFDEQTISIRLNQSLKKLEELQHADGSWSWWKGMDGSPYMTTAVSEMFIRINTMVGKRDDNKKMLDKAFTFMDKVLKDEEEYLRKLQAQGVVVRPSETALNILYNYALDGREPSDKTKATIQYLIDLLDDKTREFTIYGKARSAVVLAHFGKEKKAELHMKSLSQYSVATEEMGRYYDTRKAYYSWCSYNIPTEVAAMEAYQRLEPDNQKVLDEMRLWLLQQKRAQMWSTPINSVDAIYAFLNGNIQVLDNKMETVLALNGKRMELSEATSGLGYVKTAVNTKGNEVFTAEKQSNGTSWGALYAQFMQDAKEVNDTKAGLSVKREIIAKNGQPKVGDKVVVRITIKAERNLDFVEVIDRRPACMEPVEQRSGYRRGCYIAPKDYTTCYYFDKMAKGTHVIETEYYIDRTGTYESGTCKAQCAYAPEFSATTKAFKIIVNK